MYFYLIFYIFIYVLDTNSVKYCINILLEHIQRVYKISVFSLFIKRQFMLNIVHCTMLHIKNIKLKLIRNSYYCIYCVLVGLLSFFNYTVYWGKK